ncbi:MAG: hypothetical protein GF355_05055, partial [Candidatus Eisenbacteria bacterium]|nr:hypothetical protein [Candidatus Eisenbacteria bacterium]
MESAHSLDSHPRPAVVAVWSLILFAGLAASQPPHAATLLVPEEFSTFAGAMSATSVGDTVSAAAGIYTERFVLADGVTLISREGPEATVLDGRGEGPIITVEFSQESAAIIGFRLINGRSSAGGAVRAVESPLRVADCLFEANVADHDAYAAKGGAVYATEGSRLRIADCEFVENGAPAGVAPALYAEQISQLTLVRCRFAGNTADEDGKAAVVLESSPRIEIDQCAFSENVPRDLHVDQGRISTVRDDDFPGGLSLRRSAEGLPAHDRTVTGKTHASNLTDDPNLSIQDCTFLSPLELVGIAGELTFNGCTVAGKTKISGSGHVDLRRNLFYAADSLNLNLQGGYTGRCNAYWRTWLEEAWRLYAEQMRPLACDTTDILQGVHAASPLLPGQHPSGYDCDTIGHVEVACFQPLVLDAQPQELSYSGVEEIVLRGYDLGAGAQWRLVGPDGIVLPVSPVIAPGGETAYMPSPLRGRALGSYDIWVDFPEQDDQVFADILNVTAGELETATPDHARGRDSVRVSVTGFPLLDGLELWLEESEEDGVSIEPRTLRVEEPDSLVAVFDLRLVPVGKYDIMVRNPNDDHLSLEKGFTLLGYAVWNVPGDFPTIQEAIDAAGDGMTIEVEPGTYTEAIDFSGKSLRIVSTEGPEVTTISAPGPNNRAVTIQQECGSFTELGGFTIRDGRRSVGAGIRCEAPALIRGCIVENNEASIDSASSYPRGGGIYAQGGARIIGNVIRRNRALDRFGDPWNSYLTGYGGGVYCAGGRVERNVIEENRAADHAAAAIYDGTFAGNLVQANIAHPDQDHYDWRDNGGLGARRSVVRGNRFLDNEGWVTHDLAADYSTIERNLFVAGCGAVHRIESCRVADNTFIGPGVEWCSPVRIDESAWLGNILVGSWLGGRDNLPTKREVRTWGEAGAASQKGNSPASDRPPRFAANLLYQCPIENEFSSDFPDWADSNLVGDPLFCNAEEGDFRVSLESPAIPGNNGLDWPDTIGAFGVGCAPLPVLMWGLDARWDGGEARLEWFLAQDTGGQGLHIDRAVVPGADRKRLTASPLPLCRECGFADTQPPRGDLLRYTLVFVELDGEETDLGSVDLAGRGTVAALSRPRPNPAPGGAALILQAPAGAPAHVAVYDAAGRHVRTLWDDPVRESPVALMWDGRTSTGHRAAPGLYFVKMTRPRAVERRL